MSYKVTSQKDLYAKMEICEWGFGPLGAPVGGIDRITLE